MVLGIVTTAEWLESLVITSCFNVISYKFPPKFQSLLTCVHCSQHAGNKLVDSITLLNQRHQGRYPTLIVCSILEMRENQFLKRVNLILEVHKVHNSLVTVLVSLNITAIGQFGRHTPRSDH